MGTCHGLGKAAGPALIDNARALGATLPPELDDPDTELTPLLVIQVMRDVAWHFFPRLAPDDGQAFYAE